MRKPSWYLINTFLAVVLLATDACCTNIDALKRSVERNLSVAQARSVLSASEALRLRQKFNTAIKQRQADKGAARNDAAIVAQMQQIQHQIDLANQRAVASRSLRFF